MSLGKWNKGTKAQQKDALRVAEKVLHDKMYQCYQAGDLKGEERYQKARNVINALSK